MSKVICLWASPRNISTALMYSFAQRNDTKVVDEPFYAYYLSKVNTDIHHPGKTEIINSQSTSFNQVLKSINKEVSEKNIFIKNMTHHLHGKRLDFAFNWINIILTRNPKNAINSFAKVINNPTQNDVGYKQQYEAALNFKKKAFNFFILDADKLLSNPSSAIKEICELCSIKFDNKMLSWSKNGIKEDGVWAPYWYENVHNTNGFKKTITNQDIVLKKTLLPLLEECNYFYKELLKMEE